MNLHSKTDKDNKSESHRDLKVNSKASTRLPKKLREPKKEKIISPLERKSVKILALIGLLFTFSIFIGLQVASYYNEEAILRDSQIIFENSIPLLAVNEVNERITSASTIPLNLRITQGSGNVYVNLNSYSEIDTQISIINSQQTICTLLELPCHSFDFYFTFNDASLVLRGPSASTSVAVLTYATINGITLDDSFALTGTLNSNGIVGLVGGVEQKIREANRNRVDRVYIPYASINSTLLQELNDELRISVKTNLDILTILEHEFPNQDFSLNLQPFDTSLYTQTMRNIGEELCILTQQYIEIVNTIEGSNESSQVQGSLNQFNFSNIARENGEYYSQGSFCYSANLGLKTFINLNTISEIEEVLEEIEQMNSKIAQKESRFNPQTFPRTLNNQHDIFVYLLISNRIFEAREFLTVANEQIENLQNESFTQNLSQRELDSSFDLAIQQLSFAQERFTTIEQWESVFGAGNSANTAQLPFTRAQEICRLYISQTQVLNQLLLRFQITAFSPQIEEIEELYATHPYLCVFNGMQLKGRMNTILTGSNAQGDELESLISQLQNIAMNRMQFNSRGELPLIPYISYEYSRTLQEVGNLQSALQYVQLALSYSELNIILDSQEQTNSNFFDQLFGTNLQSDSNELTPLQVQQLEEVSMWRLVSYFFLVLSIGFATFVIIY